MSKVQFARHVDRSIEGKRVKLVRCNDPYTRLRPGALGTVLMVDAMGTVHVNWDNGACLGLCVDDGDAYDLV